MREGRLTAKYFPFDTRQNSPSSILCPSLAPREPITPHSIPFYACLLRYPRQSFTHQTQSVTFAGEADSSSRSRLTPTLQKSLYVLQSSPSRRRAFVPLLICLLRFSLALMGGSARARRSWSYALASPLPDGAPAPFLEPVFSLKTLLLGRVSDRRWRRGAEGVN